VQIVRKIQYFTFSGNYFLLVVWPKLFYILSKYSNECKWISITTLNVTDITCNSEVHVTAMLILLLGNWNTITMRGCPVVQGCTKFCENSIVVWVKGYKGSYIIYQAFCTYITKQALQIKCVRQTHTHTHMNRAFWLWKETSWYSGVIQKRDNPFNFLSYHLSYVSLFTRSAKPKTGIPGIMGSSTSIDRDFSLLCTIQTGSGIHPVSHGDKFLIPWGRST